MFGFFKKKHNKDLDGNKFPDFGEGVVEKIRRQNYLVKHSRLHEVFRSAKPITDERFLVGRENILTRSNQLLQAEGTHIILFGDRGVGKSSLGNVLLDVFQRTRDDERLYIYRCNADTQLRDMVAGILLFKGKNINEVQRVASKHKNNEVNLGATIGVNAVGSISGGGRIVEAVSSEALEVGDRELANDPSWVAQHIHGIDGLVFIDELDKVANPEVKHKLATLVKAVSDYRESRLNFVLAGIAQNAAELTAGHPSVQRCLREVPVERLTAEALKKIIDVGEEGLLSWNGSEWLPLHFDEDVKNEIARLSFGYPYFTQLLATHAAEVAILKGKNLVTTDMLDEAVRTAVNDAEDDLKKSLVHALKEDSSSMFKNLLRSAAEVSATTISAQELRQAVFERTGQDLSAQQVNPYLRRLVGDKETLEEVLSDVENPKPIFIRIGVGQYRFFDPRMPSYIRLALSGSNDQSDVVPLLQI